MGRHGGGLLFLRRCLEAEVIRYVPFHDARKWQREGLRTRDAHVFHELARHGRPSDLLVLNRPTCLAELVRLGGRWRTGGRVLRRGLLSQVAALSEGCCVTDCVLPQLGLNDWSFHVWLAGAYGSARYESATTGLLSGTDSAPVVWLCHPFA